MAAEPTFTFTESQFAEFSRVLVHSFRQVMEPAAAPSPELVTVGETSEHKLDVQVLCSDCLRERGSSWMAHSVYHWGFDPEKPDRPKRHTVRVFHPEAPKIISYDAQAVKAGLEAGTHGKQCLQCGKKLAILV
jgi:hypothetical protein